MSMGIVVTWVAVGLVAGWLAGQFMRGGYGLVGDVVLGIIGAIVASYVGGLILGRDLMVTGFTCRVSSLPSWARSHSSPLSACLTAPSLRRPWSRRQ